MTRKQNISVGIQTDLSQVESLPTRTQSSRLLIHTTGPDNIIKSTRDQLEPARF